MPDEQTRGRPFTSLPVFVSSSSAPPTSADHLRRRVSSPGKRRAHSPVEIASRGLLPGGRPAPPQVVAAAAPFGVDLSAHSSTQLSTDDLKAADVVGP